MSFTKLSNTSSKTDKFFQDSKTVKLLSYKNTDIDTDVIENDEADVLENRAQLHSRDTYKFDDQEYFYLSDHLLSQKFGDFMNTDKQYKIHICIFKLNRECDIPFLQFLLDNTGEILDFPKIDFHCPVISSPQPTPILTTATVAAAKPSQGIIQSIQDSIGSIFSSTKTIGGQDNLATVLNKPISQENTQEISQDIKQEIVEEIPIPFSQKPNPILDPLLQPSQPSAEYTDESQEHIFFMNECSQALLKILPIHDMFDPETLQTMYKGFAESGDDLYIMFDATTIPVNINPSKYVWTIIDEIMNSQMVLTKQVSQDLSKLFLKIPELADILDKDGHKIMRPNALYLCTNMTKSPDNPTIEIPDTTYKNIHTSVDNTVAILDNTVDHPWLGNNYFFTSRALYGVDYKTIIRYAVFTYSARYILKEMESISQEEKDAFSKILEEDADNSSIYFWENGIQMWCIKSSDQFTIIE